MGFRASIHRIYERFTPFVQVIGWILVAAPVMYTALSGFEKVLAFDQRLTAVETLQASYKDKVDKLNDKLEDIMEFWQIPHKRSEP